MQQEIDELKKLKYTLETLRQNRTGVSNQIKALESQVESLDKDMALIIESKQFYKKAIDIVYERSVQELKDILNSALSFIYSDRDFEIDIELTDKRGKSLSFRMYENGKPVNLKRGTGMGIKCVISAILHIYYLQCKNSKILMLDETYSNIDKEHIPAFFEFVSQMCKNLHFKVIMITHDERFIDYGDKYYRIIQGDVSES